MTLTAAATASRRSLLARPAAPQQLASPSILPCRSEAKPLFCAAGGVAPPPGVRSLLELLNEYVRLKEIEARRLALAGRNPLARRLLDAVDLEAGQQQQAVTAEAAAAAAQQQQAAAAAAVVQQVQQPLHAFVPVQQSGGYVLGQPPAHLHPLDLAAAAPAAAGQQQQQHGGTPGRHRKGQPRKRQRLADGDAADAAAAAAAAAAEAADGLGPPGMGSGGLFGDGGGSGAGWGSPMDILNQPLDAGGLEALLDDGPLQVGGATGWVGQRCVCKMWVPLAADDGQPVPAWLLASCLCGQCHLGPTLIALCSSAPLAQKAFAEHLAQHINTTVFGVHAPVAEGEAAEAAAAAAGAVQAAAAGAAEEDGGEAGGEGYLEHFMADPQMVLAELPADPEVLQVLQQVVRPSTASPPHTRPTSRQQAVQQQEQAQQQQQQQQQQAGEAQRPVLRPGSGRRRQQQPVRRGGRSLTAAPSQQEAPQQARLGLPIVAAPEQAAEPCEAAATEMPQTDVQQAAAQRDSQQLVEQLPEAQELSAQQQEEQVEDGRGTEEKPGLQQQPPSSGQGEQDAAAAAITAATAGGSRPPSRVQQGAPPSGSPQQGHEEGQQQQQVPEQQVPVVGTASSGSSPPPAPATSHGACTRAASVEAVEEATEPAAVLQPPGVPRSQQALLQPPVRTGAKLGAAACPRAALPAAIAVSAAAMQPAAAKGAEAVAQQLKAAMAEMDLPASRDQLLQELDELDDLDFA